MKFPRVFPTPTTPVHPLIPVVPTTSQAPWGITSEDKQNRKGLLSGSLVSRGKEERKQVKEETGQTVTDGDAFCEDSKEGDELEDRDRGASVPAEVAGTGVEVEERARLRTQSAEPTGPRRD